MCKEFVLLEDLSSVRVTKIVSVIPRDLLGKDAQGDPYGQDYFYEKDARFFRRICV